MYIFYFALPHNFSNGPFVMSKYIAFLQFQVVAVVVVLVA